MAANPADESSSSTPNKGKQNVPPSLLKHYESLQPLAIHKVRWFYQEDGNWVPFNGADSINIEKVFRDVEEVETKSSKVSLNVCATVRGSLYEADVLDRECRPFYWSETPVPIRRGTWFAESSVGKWEPFDENESALIEDGNRKFVSSLGFGAIYSPLAEQNAIFQMKVGKNRVEWHDIFEVFMISETAGSRFAQKIGFSGPRRLYRGYKIDCDENDSMGDITHIVFLVHGMGQLYYGEGSIVNSRKKFIEILNRTEGGIDCRGERVEFFPIEWRTKLKLDEGIIDSITPDTLGSLRKMLNATTMDVLYYASPLYREEIIQTMREKLNFVYRQFCSRNPYFEDNGGKVSIIAHSLGSVIIHDLLSLWNSYMLEKNESSADVNVAAERPSSSWSWRSFFGSKSDLAANSPTEEVNMDDLREQLHNARLKVLELESKLNNVNDLKYNSCKDDSHCLSFKVENVFLIGSPLGVFLVMRGIRPREDMEHHLIPTSVCKKYLNIYDPSDPIAYRLEPLIYGHYSSIAPVRLTHVNTPQERPIVDSRNSWLSSLFKSKSKTEAEVDECDSSESMDNDVEQRKESLRVGRVLLHRIDYVLETSLVEYFSAITSHQGYWQNPDFVKFVIRTICVSREEELMDIPSRL